MRIPTWPPSDFFGNFQAASVNRLPGCGAIDELGAIDSVKAITGEKDQSRISTVVTKYPFVEYFGCCQGISQTTLASFTQRKPSVQQFAMIIVFVRLRKISDRALRLIVASAKQDACTSCSSNSGQDYLEPRTWIVQDQEV